MRLRNKDTVIGNVKYSNIIEIDQDSQMQKGEGHYKSSTKMYRLGGIGKKRPMAAIDDADGDRDERNIRQSSYLLDDHGGNLRLKEKIQRIDNEYKQV